jgi:8-oxo-dGTP diphosphatase
MGNYDPNYVHVKHFFIVGGKAIILNSENKILLVKRSEKYGLGGKWSYPGGALEDGENPIEGVKREIMEETQLEVVGVRQFWIKNVKNKDGDTLIIVGYVCHAKSDNVVLNWEHDEYRWVTGEEGLSLIPDKDGESFLEKFLELEN